MKKNLYLALFALFLFSSCSPKSSHDFEMQGKAHLEKLTKELKKIDDLEQLQEKQISLKKRFLKLAKFLSSYQSYLDKHPEDQKEPVDDLVLTANLLKEELSRILAIDGAEDILIEIEKDASLSLALSY